MIRVTMKFGSKPIRKYTFDKGVVAIGRDPSCEIVVDNIGASRRHATIEKTDDGYVLEDLKSHNGTFVKGEKIFHHSLHDSDEFFIGKYCFVFETLEPVVDVDDGLASLPTPPNNMPDMTFRLDRKEIQRIMGHSARGTAPQLVQIAPEGNPQAVVLDRAYYILGADPACEIKLTTFLSPAKAAVIVRGDHGFRVVGVSRRFRLNGKPVSDGPLVDGDLLSCGGCRFRFCQA